MFIKFSLKLFLAAFVFGFSAFIANAATITVTDNSDPSGAGNCLTGGNCSLRQAITAATSGDTIVFNIPAANCPNNVCTVNLTLGTIVVSKSLNITGTSAENLIIRRNTAQGVNFCIFGVGNNQGGAIIVRLIGLTVSNGAGEQFSGNVGGINSFGQTSLILERTVVSNNSGDSVGGIYNGGMQLQLMDSTVKSNTGGTAGGIINVIGETMLLNSVVSNNTGQSTGATGGIVNNNGRLTIWNSTISGNLAQGATSMSAFNVGGVSSGGSQVNPSIVNIINATIANNRATNSTGNGATGGLVNSNGTANVRNTIVSGNTIGDNSQKDTSGTFTSQGNNLISSVINTTGFGGSDILGLNPNLGPLANNGGITETMALLPGSLGINLGNNCITDATCGAVNNVPFPFTVDQRNVGFPRKSGTAVDIGAFELQSRKTPFDFDGDSKTDIGIFRPAPGEWWINRSSNNSTFATQFGQTTDKLVPADFTGDGKADVAVWRPSNGNWFVLRSEDLTFYSFPFGANGDTPVPADYDADGKADAAVFRPSNSTWFISKSSGGTTIQQFGVSGDVPVAADYDGDGKADIAIFRANGANGAEWWINRSANNSVFATQFGAATDKAVFGDYTGDGKADVAIFRPSNGNWFILRSEDFSFYSFPFGANGDTPAPGDYDGDGKIDAAVFRPSNSTWYANRSTAGTLIQQFGIAGDKPLPNSFVP